MVEGGKARSAISSSGSKTCSEKVSEFVQMGSGVPPTIALSPGPQLVKQTQLTRLIVLYLFPLLTLQ